MLSRIRLAACAMALVAGALALPDAALAQAGVKVGNLTCNVSSGWGFVFGSSRNLNCTFAGPAGIEYYTGAISKFGVDIGYTTGGVMIWTVLAPTTQLVPGSLAGGYAGATASATVGVGLGANALIGGNGGSIVLQPLSIEGNQGFNVAGGIGAISLTPVRR
jgi:hypothetical protein